MRKLLVTAVVVAAGVLAPTALAEVAGPGNTAQAREIVTQNVGDVPAPNEKGIANNAENLPDAAFNSVTRNPICGDYSGTAP